VHEWYLVVDSHSRQSAAALIGNECAKAGSVTEAVCEKVGLRKLKVGTALKGHNAAHET
jgi:hypothetical protein